MHSCPEGRVALRPSATPGAEPEEARLCLQRSCPMLTRTQGPAACRQQEPSGASRVLPTVRDDHLLLGLPVLAALGLRGRTEEAESGRERGGSRRLRNTRPRPPHPSRRPASPSRPGAPLLLPHTAAHLNLPQDVQAFCDLPEHDVLAVQPICLVTRQEELGAIGVWARIGHGEQAWGEKDQVGSLHPALSSRRLVAEARVLEWDEARAGRSRERRNCWRLGSEWFQWTVGSEVCLERVVRTGGREPT